MAAEDPSVSGVSGRYATALFELARDEKSVDAVKADLDRFDAMLADSADLKRLVRSPVFSSDSQSRALAAILDKCLAPLPDRRYGSARDVAADIDNHVKHRPVRAHSASSAYVVSKFIR